MALTFCYMSKDAGTEMHIEYVFSMIVSVLPCRMITLTFASHSARMTRRVPFFYEPVPDAFDRLSLTAAQHQLASTCLEKVDAVLIRPERTTAHKSTVVRQSVVL